MLRDVVSPSVRGEHDRRSGKLQVMFGEIHAALGPNHGTTNRDRYRPWTPQQRRVHTRPVGERRANAYDRSRITGTAGKS